GCTGVDYQRRDRRWTHPDLADGTGRARELRLRDRSRGAPASTPHSHPPSGRRMRMLARRLSLYLVTAWVAITVNFLLPRMLPGNPVQQLIGKLTGNVTPQEVH